MTTIWHRLPGTRFGEYCDAHGHRLVVEASRWSPPQLFGERHEEYNGFIGGVRVGSWIELDEAKREVLSLARSR